jgi:hypothetical protein
LIASWLVVVLHDQTFFDKQGDTSVVHNFKKRKFSHVMVQVRLSFTGIHQESH